VPASSSPPAAGDSKPALAALELIASIGVARVHDHDVALANRLRAGLELAPGNSAIVSLRADARAGERLRAAGVTVSTRAGRIRISPHLHNGEADIDRALDALRAVDTAGGGQPAVTSAGSSE